MIDREKLEAVGRAVGRRFVGAAKGLVLAGICLAACVVLPVLAVAAIVTGVVAPSKIQITWESLTG